MAFDSDFALPVGTLPGAAAASDGIAHNMTQRKAREVDRKGRRMIIT
jgi:hypothetical protein